MKSPVNLKEARYSKFKETSCSTTGTNLEEEMDEHRSNASIIIFTKEEEISLLKQIKVDKQLLCICKSCLLNHLRSLIYQAAYEKKKPYPKAWDENRQVDLEWLRTFEIRNEDEISKFSLNRKICLERASMKKRLQSKILTFSEERRLLRQMQEKKIQFDCICKKCIMIEIPRLVYTTVRNFKRCYPKSWDKAKKAGYDWLNGFLRRHKVKLSKFPSAKFCKKVSKALTSKRLSKILTTIDERWLLIQLQEMDISNGCKCKNCLMKKVPFLAYKIARNSKRHYPKSWDRHKKAEPAWLKGFKERHKDDISKFSSVICKKELSQVSTNELKQPFQSAILTTDDERLLLTQLQEKGFEEGYKDDISKFSSVGKQLSRAPTREQLFQSKVLTTDAEQLLLTQLQEKGFEERHEIKIPKFSSVRKENLSRSSRSKSLNYSNILTKDDERLLLTQVQEIETIHGCKCKNCLMREVPSLAYKMAYELKRFYPKSWGNNKSAGISWFVNFKERNKHEISKFSSICKRKYPSKEELLESKQILTLKEERSLLEHIKETKTDCICQQCVLTQVLPLAYILAHNKNRFYPKSWDRDKRAGRCWLKNFKERHRNEIFNFPFICKKRLVSRQIFTPQEERLLLEYVEKTKTDCICQKCVLTQVSLLAYLLSHYKKRSYPKSWNRDKQASRYWLGKFKERHTDKISRFSVVCKARVTSSRRATVEPFENFN